MTRTGEAPHAARWLTVRSGALVAFPESSLDGAEVSSPLTSVSPVRTSFTNEPREREGGDKNEPVKDQRQSFEAAGTESVTVDKAEHEGRGRPTTPKHSPRERVNSFRSTLIPYVLPAGITQVRPYPGTGEKCDEERGDRTYGTNPQRDGRKNNDGEHDREDVYHGHFVHFAGSVSTNSTALSIQAESWRSVSIPSGPMMTHPFIGRRVPIWVT